MKKHRTLGILFWALSMLFLAAQAQAQDTEEQVQDTEETVAQEGPSLADADYTSASHKPLQAGEWFWSLSADPVLMSGASAVAVDPVSPSTLYVGGPGYIAVSTNGGDDWLQQLTFSADFAEGAEDGENTADSAEMDASQRVEALREYLRTELEQQFDLSYVDNLMDAMTDDEILQAREVTDIEALEDLDLEMDPDLTNVDLGSTADFSVVLSDFDGFRERYEMMVQAGASESVAAQAAAKSGAVWSFVTAGASVFAVTPEVVYVTADSGATWNALAAAPVGAHILSMGVSADRNLVVLGTTDGVLLSRNGGGSWIAFDDDVVRGAVYAAKVIGDGAAQNIVVLTTEAFYESVDDGLTWQEISGPFASGERVLDFEVGAGGRLFVHTNRGLYYRGVDHRWQPIGDGPFVDENVRQIAVSDPTFSRIYVRTDAHVFVLDLMSGWTGQNQGLLSNELGQFQPVPGEKLFAIIASPSGVWCALAAEEVELSPEYKALKQQWESEPSDDYVVKMALRAHYVEGWLDGIGLRSRLSWLLPTVSFDYFYEQNRQNSGQRDYNMRAGYLTQEKFSFTREKEHYWQIMAFWRINIEKGQKDELSAKTKMMSFLRDRDRLTRKVMAELSKRRTLQIRLALELQKYADKKPKKMPKRLFKLILGVQECEATLHYLTGGFYIPAVHQNDTKNF